MKIQFIGATHEVTGSCTLLEAGDKKGIVDCGMEQGKDLFVNQELPVAASEIDFVLLTHAHIDHSGLLPLLYKDGFRGSVYTSAATCQLCEIMLRDSAHIQMSEAEWKSRKAMRKGGEELQPIQPVLLKTFEKIELLGKNHARIEAPYILYSEETDYYYLFLSFGGLNAADGYNIRVCRSKNPDGPYVDALGHDMSEWFVVTEATCTADGMEQRDCSRCNHHETQVIEAAGHDYESVVTEPTCTEGGYTTYTCSCGDSYIADETAPLGHTEQILPGKEATCTETGLTEGRKCAVCGEILVAQEEIPALGHDYSNGKCTRCDAVKTSSFVDVKAGDFFFDPVEWAVEKGITTGTDATHFDPNGNCMRGHVVTFLWRAMGSPEPETSVNPFVDVKESDYFYKAVLWAYEKGITTGIDAIHFAPTGNCNRAQVVTFLWRAMGKPDSNAEVTFTDVKTGEFYTTAVAWAVENNITNGMGDGTFGVNGTCNRAQVVTFLYRALNK